MGGLLVAQLLVAAAGDLPERVQVRLAGERVSVRADAAPLSQVLDSLAQRTGMKVVWERNLGRPNVSASLEDCTPAEAVVRLLQGSGFNYALGMDPSGTRVEMLIIVEAPLPEPPARPGFVPPRRAEVSPAAPGLEAEEPPEEEDPTSGLGQPDEDDAQGSPPGSPANPAAGAVFPPVLPSMPAPQPASAARP